MQQQKQIEKQGSEDILVHLSKLKRLLIKMFILCVFKYEMSLVIKEQAINR